MLQLKGIFMVSRLQDKLLRSMHFSSMHLTSVFEMQKTIILVLVKHLMLHGGLLSAYLIQIHSPQCSFV